VAPGVAVNYHDGLFASQGVIMSKDGDAEPTDFMRRLIELRGLQRAYALFPDIVASAFVRGRRPIAAVPEKFAATTEPAGRFSAIAEPDE
jgi:hypothetical protein